MNLDSYLRGSANNSSDVNNIVGNSDCGDFCSLMLSLFVVVEIIYLTFCADVLFNRRGRDNSR